MAKKSCRKNRRRRNGGKSYTKPTCNESNFVSTAGPGCFIARKGVENDWLLDWQTDVDISEFGGQDIPDVALDPQDSSVTFCNASEDTKVAYISIFNATIRGKAGQVLEPGTTTDNHGTSRTCHTFIIQCPPRTFCHLGYIDVEDDENITTLEIDSDVHEWSAHPQPADEHAFRLGFPLEGGPFLCTQSESGYLTHFFSGNLHAIDLRCETGTPLLAVANGKIVEVEDANTLTGIAVSNLFTWNGIVLEVDDTDDPLYCEYVHIASSSVKVGDVVTKGQVIGTSGSVGFSPEPHLHFSAFRSPERTAATVRVRFESETDGKVFLPVAGQWYTAQGQVETPTNRK
jgi:hypothetical protein